MKQIKSPLRLEALKIRHIYTGIHNGVTVEIANWGFDSDSARLKNWNYYLYLTLDKFENKELAESLWLEDQTIQITPTSPVRVRHDYYGNSFLAGLEMHGGITFYEKLTWDTKRVIKVGCDFMHLYDDQTSWTLNMILADAISCVDKMLENTKYNE